jgi:hypothetical protein
MHHLLRLFFSTTFVNTFSCCLDIHYAYKNNHTWLHIPAMIPIFKTYTIADDELVVEKMIGTYIKFPSNINRFDTVIKNCNECYRMNE